MKFAYSSSYQLISRKLKDHIKGLLQHNAKLFK
jgi:hypothetical protein